MIIAQRGARVKCRPLDELVRAMKINATPMVENIG
jgi:hypothetical protein